jgi:hypothetical protein
MIAWLLLVTGARADCPFQDAPKVRYDGQTFTATMCGSGTWAGATVRRATDGAQLDLPAVAVTGETVTVSGEVGPGIVQYFLATWEDKEPCAAGRHGCVAYGYQLRGIVEGWPKWDGEWDPHPFADFTPVSARVLDAGGGPALVKRVRDALSAATFQRLIDGGRAAAPRTEIVVLYRGRWDRIRAWEVASRLREAEIGVRWSVAHWPEAPDAFVIAVGAP